MAAGNQLKRLKWNSLLLFKRLLFCHELLLYIGINFHPDTSLAVQTAKNHKGSPFLHKRNVMLLPRRVKSQKFKTLYFQNERRYRAGNL